MRRPSCRKTLSSSSDALFLFPGHKVVRLRVIREGSDGISVEGEEDFVWAADGPQWSTGLRPVDVAFGPGGKMFISSRTTGEILVVSSTGAE